MGQPGFTSAPIIQQQELTWKCNNSCAFCYNPERCVEQFQPRASDRKCNVAVAEESVKRGVMAVCPTGGEPLLVGDHLFEILDIYKQAGCYTSINTNGRLVTEVNAGKLAQAKLNTALVSIHGVGELHDRMVGIPGAFAETLGGIERLRGQGVSVTPNFVATAKNISGLRPVGQLLAIHGLKAMTVTPFLPSWGSQGHCGFVLQTADYRAYFEAIRYIRTLGVTIDSTLPIPPCVLVRHFPQNWQEYLDVHSPRVCMAGRSFGVVSPDGKFRACIQAPYLVDFGGLVTESYSASWRRANGWADLTMIPDACRDCAALDVCGGGCRTSCMWENNGSVTGSTMYMGKPLTSQEARPFLDRVVWTGELPAGTCFRLAEGVKVRDEGWGVIACNPAYQSFTVLSPEARSYLNRGVVYTFNSQKIARVLSAIKAIEPVSSIGQVAQWPDTISVLPGNILLPRLARHLTDSGHIYCLRADTGERYFF